MKYTAQTTDYLLVCMLVFTSSNASVLAISNVTLVIFFLFTFTIFHYRNLKIDKAFIYFSFVYYGVLCLYLYKFGSIDIAKSIREYIKIFYAYITIKMLYENFFRLYVDLIYKLAIVSIPLYILQLLDYSLMKNLVGIIEHNILWLDYRESWYENIVVFTLNDDAEFRNSGFAWEPKGFGVFLILALLFNSFLTNFRFLDKKSLILILTMLTTFSTATYSVLFAFVLPLFMINKSLKVMWLALILFLPAVLVAFIELDFLRDKIVYEYQDRERFVEYQFDKKYKGETRSLGRFGSLLVDYNDLIKEPWIGYGMQSDRRTMVSVNGVKLVRVNGLSDFTAKFGIIGLCFLIYGLLRTSKRIALQNDFKASYLFVLTILSMSFASAILLSPLFLAFTFYGFIFNSKFTESYRIPKRNIPIHS